MDLQSARGRIISLVSHPNAIRVKIAGNHLILGGLVLESELQSVLSIASKSGAEEVENQLTVLHESEVMPRSRVPFRSVNILKLLLGGIATGLISYGWRRRDRTGGFLIAVGLGGVAQMLSGKTSTLLIEIALSPVFRIKRELRVDVPAEFAYEWWARFENFSRFMSYVEDVQVNAKGGLTWKIKGPGGILMNWDAEIVRLDRHRSIEWRSLPGAAVMNAGLISFAGDEQGLPESCRIGVELRYSPPAGMLGYGLARILGFDPRTKIDGDLSVMKALLESEFGQQAAQDEGQRFA